MNGCVSMRPIELQSGADQLSVPASAVRPPVSRRGRRSSVASHRRWISWQARSPGEVRRDTFPPISEVSPPAGDSLHGKSGDESPFNCCCMLGFSILHVNIQSINSHIKRAMLSAQLERFEPDILVLNETWLDGSVSSIDIANYCLVSRRDRPNSKVGKLNHGGVAFV